MKLIFFLILSFLCFYHAHSQGDDIFSELNKKEYKNVYALIVGVSEYSESDLQLKYADHDADVMYAVLVETFPGNRNNIKTLKNSEATEFAIKSGLRDLVSKSKEGDLVIFYFSGHGDAHDQLVEGKKGYFLSYDASGDRVYELGGAVPFDFVNNALKRITSTNKADAWIMTDACHSGNVIDSVGSIHTMASLNQLFLNTTKFISCAAKEKSFENDSIEQGVFTYFLVKALAGEADTDERTGVLTADEINSYMRKHVRLFTEGKQTPTIKNSDDFTDILTVNGDLKGFIKDLDEEDFHTLLASRGVDGNETDTTFVKSPEYSVDDYSPQVKLFMDKLYEGKLHSSNESAYELYKEAIHDPGYKDFELKEMKKRLLEELIQRGQHNTKRFLAGKPMIGDNEQFRTTYKDFKIAAELVDHNDPIREEYENRAEFYAAMYRIEEDTELEKAESILMALTESKPDAAYVNQALALLYIKLADKSKAEKQLSEAKSKLNSWSKPVNSEAYLNILAGQLDEAEKNIESSVKLNNDSDNTFILRAYLHAANFELQHASKALDEVNALNSSYSQGELTELEGRINELRGRIHVAEQQYREALNENGSNVDLLIRLAQLYKDKGDTAQAINYYKKVQRINKDNQTAELNIAMLRGNPLTFDPNKVGKKLEEIIAVVEALDAAKKYQDAIDILENAKGLNGWNPDLYYQLGKLYYSVNNVEASISTLKKAIELSPYHYRSLRALTLIYLHQKKFSQAEALIMEHDKYFMESSKWLTLKYQVYRQMGSKRDLYVVLEKALELDSLDTDAYKALYTLNIENGMFKEAKMEFDNLTNLGGTTYKDINDFYGKVETQVKLQIDRFAYDGLKEGIQILLDKDPYNLEFVYFMALMHYMEMNYDGANEELHKFSKFIKELSPATQIEYYRLRGKVHLETGNADLALRAFQLVGGSSMEPMYMEMAMAKYELNNPGWTDDFFRAGRNLTDLNEDALKRYEKMKKKASKSQSGGFEKTRR